MNIITFTGTSYAAMKVTLAAYENHTLAQLQDLHESGEIILECMAGSENKMYSVRSA